MLLLCLSSLGDMGCAPGPIARCAHVGLGKAHPVWDRSPPGLWGGCGDSLEVGTTHEGLCPALYPIAYRQGGESLSATWDQGHPVCLPACPVEGLRLVLGFGHFAGFCPFCWV